MYGIVKEQLYIFTVIVVQSISKVEGCITEDCNRNGDCINGQCICISGFFDDKNTPESDCDGAFADVDRTRWNSMRFTYFSFFIVMSISSLVVLYATLKNSKRSTTDTVSNIRKFVLISMCIIGVARATYYAYDPKFRRQPFISWMFFGFPFPIALSAFFCVLFYWIDMYNVAVDSLKKEEMLQKINSKYMGRTITFEEVVNRIRFLRRLKIPFIIGVSVVFLMWGITGIFYYQVKGYRTVETVFYAVVILIWIILGIGFLTYGRKLVQLMPPQITKKVKKLTQRISILVVVIIVSTLTASTIGTVYEGISGPEYYLGQFIAVESMILIVCSAIIILFAKPSKEFPYCFGKNSYQSSTNDFLNNSNNSNLVSI